MSILSTMTPDKLALAVCTEDTKAIAKTPGIGAKTAARIVLELKDKISKDMLGSTTAAATKGVSQTAMPISNSSLSEATEALMVLGYDKNSILAALKGIDTTKDVGEIIKAALKKLAR